ELAVADRMTGQLQGTPPTAGLYNLLVHVKDAAGQRAFQAFLLRVQQPGGGGGCGTCTEVAWGLNTSGQLGDGSLTPRTTPTPVAGLRGVTGRWAGGGHSLAVTADGTAWSWGDNSLGQLGDGTQNSRATPQRVPGLSGIVALAAGYLHSLALTAG